MKIIKKLIVAAILCSTLSNYAFAQYSTNSYFMENSTQSNMLNPAFAPERGYVLIPVLGGTGVSLGSNSLSVDKLFYPNPNGSGLVSFLDVDIDKSILLNSISDDNNVLADASTTVFGIGFHSDKLFWSFGMNIRTSNDLNVPREVFDFIALNQQDGIYNINSLSANVTASLETYVGATMQINDKLSVGAKLKILLGVVDATMQYDNLQLEMNDAEWKITADGFFHGTAAGLELMDNTKDFAFDNLEYNPEFNVTGFGMGIDLGASYKIMDNLSVSASVLDLGFMSWGADNSLAATSTSNYSYSGATFSNNTVNSEALDIDKLLSFEDAVAENRTTSLKTTIHAGAEYRFLKDKMAAGLLYSGKFRYNNSRHELTAVVSGRPCDWFTANLSYAFIGGQMGAAVNFHPKWINFFLGADYIPFSVTPQMLPVESKNLNLYVGIGIPLGKRL